MDTKQNYATAFLDQVHFSLDQERFRQFAALLDAPVEPSTGLERLLGVRSPWDGDTLASDAGTA